MALPKVVVFDLDACCWFPEMYMVRRGPPFTKTSENACAASDGEAIKLLGQTRKVWETISNGDEWQDCRVAVASRCDEPDWARQLLKLFTIDDGRSFWQALDDGRLAEIYKGNKKTHLKALKQKTGVAFEDMLFFDDDMENIRNVSELGVVSVLTPEGVTADAWEQGLRRFMEAKLYERRGGAGPGYGKTYSK
jgi:magnesium-dependent phosphatase 1